MIFFLSFHVFVRLFAYLLWRNACLGLFPLFDWIVCFSVRELYELLVYFGNNPLSVVSFAIIFSHSEGCLFTLLIVSFGVQKLLSLIRSHLFTFFFNFHYSRRWVIEDLALLYIIECSGYVFF